MENPYHDNPPPADPAARPAAPRWIASHALPPGYEPDDGGEPAVVPVFRVYCALASLGGAMTAAFAVYQAVQERAKAPAIVGSWGLLVAMGTIGFLSHLLGLLTPRKPWMHVVGIVILGLGLLSNCCAWVLNLPLLIFWLQPDVKRWFDSGASAQADLNR